MPTQFDLSKNNYLRKPDYYNEEDKEEALQLRIFDSVYEQTVPPLPTPKMERDYIDWLERDFRSDSWFHRHFRCLQAGPSRIAYKNYRKLNRAEFYENLFFFMVGTVLVSPLAIYVGKRMRVTSGGVPRVNQPIQKFD